MISNGRAEIIVGRGSFIESYPLFGFDLKNYDELFSEKLDLLLKIRDSVEVHWVGKHRAPLTGQGVYPRPVQASLPIRIGVGGTPSSVVRAARLGFPLTVAIIGGNASRFRPLTDLYRQEWINAGHDPKTISIGIHSIGFVADSDEEAAELMFPSYAKTFNRIGKERGWPPVSREQFDAERSPRGGLYVGSAESVAKKIVAMNESLGGIDQFSLQMDGSMLPHGATLRATELLGTKVQALVNRQLVHSA